MDLPQAYHELMDDSRRVHGSATLLLSRACEDFTVNYLASLLPLESHDLDTMIRNLKYSRQLCVEVLKNTKRVQLEVEQLLKYLENE